jgi:hypothetical protein
MSHEFWAFKATCNTRKVGASILLQILTPSVEIQMDHPFSARRALSESEVTRSMVLVCAVEVKRLDEGAARSKLRATFAKLA